MSMAKLAPRSVVASPDAAPGWVAGGTPEPLRSELTGLLGPDRLLTRASDLIRYASDASPYRLIPQAVVLAKSPDDVARALAFGRREQLAVVLRAGGTSLNGQAQTDGILVDVRRHFRGVEVIGDGERVRVKPGTLVGEANRVLAPYGYRLGPDPASTDIACVGGVVANNSGGMRCGVTQDSYSTVRAMRFVTPSGTSIDTASADAEERFAAAEPELAAGLLEIRGQILADEALTATIRRKFEIKNTTGYRLCAFLDAETPVEIFRRLLIGSEGTLGFIAEVEFETVRQPPRTVVSLLHFPTIDAAIEPVQALVAAGARAVELMIAPGLILASESIRGTPESWRSLDPASAALLVEFGGTDDGELDAAEARAAAAIEGLELIREPVFHRDPETIEVYWGVREALGGLAGRMRPPGTALIAEDVCVRPDRMGEMAKDLQALLTEHGFLPGVSGHASAGNLHFTLTPDFSKPEDVERYEAFMERMVELVVGRYDGSLKAEHGTGRNMAPFVEREWGPKATELMRRIKRLADPEGFLAPGVLIDDDDPGSHLRNLKTYPSVEEEIDVCVECGFCEPVCPSRHLTTTPRQRIALRREMARQPSGSALQRALLEEYEYDSIQTCAADGTCALACPLGIDTGKFVKELRVGRRSDRSERVAMRLAGSWARVEQAARAGLAAGATGRPARAALRGASRVARRALSEDLVPEWPANMPLPAQAKLSETRRPGPAAVYMPACVNRIFGRALDGEPEALSLPEAMVAVSARAGRPLWIPPDVAGHCCGTPWTSKGYRAAAGRMADKTIASLWRWSDSGRLPVICDASSCTLGLSEEAVGLLSDVNAERHGQLRIVDSIAWARTELLPHLSVGRRLGSIAVHPPCASRHLGLDADLVAIGSELAEEVVVPSTATCCGFAGDRGLLHPELPLAATADQARELAGRRFDASICSNRTCEIGLQQGTGRPYESFVLTLERLTR